MLRHGWARPPPPVQLPGFKRILNYIKKVEEQEVRSVLPLRGCSWLG